MAAGTRRSADVGVTVGPPTAAPVPAEGEAAVPEEERPAGGGALVAAGTRRSADVGFTVGPPTAAPVPAEGEEAG